MSTEAINAPGEAGEPVLLTRDGAIATISFNNPENLNAFWGTTGPSLVAAFEEINDDESIKVIIFRGEGRAFSVGGNMNFVGTQYNGAPPAEGEKRQRIPQRRYLNQDERGMKTQRAISHSNKVVIAEGKGYIVGVALELFLCADILICAEGTRMFYPPARMAGVSNDTLFWILRMGPTLSAEMTFMGRTITAEEALERDMINRVVPLDQLEATVRAAADAVCCIPADGLAIAKYNRKAAFEILGRGADKFNSVLGHAMQMTIKLEEGEWNLNKERQEYGTKEAWRRRDARFEEALNRYKPEN